MGRRKSPYRRNVNVRFIKKKKKKKKKNKSKKKAPEQRKASLTKSA